MANNFIQENNGNYFLASKITKSVFSYDVSQTHMLSCGIHSSTSPTAQSDADFLSTTLIEEGFTHATKRKLLQEMSGCTTEAMKRAFQAKAMSVGWNGAFIFAYHGSSVACSRGRSLFSSSFDESIPKTHITASVILGWLRELESKPTQILMFLDCLSAGEIAQAITSPPAIPDIETICVFYSDTQVTPSFLISPLEHSVFTYFTAWAFKTFRRSPELPQERQIHIKAIARKLRECSSALRALCITLTHPASTEDPLTSIQIQPLLQRHGDDRSDFNYTDGGDDIDGKIGRFDFLINYFDKSGPQVRLCKSVQQWLDHLKTGPLYTLHQNEVLAHDEMLSTLLRMLLYSIAYIQAASEARESIEKKNFLIAAFIQAVSTIEHVTTAGVQVNARYFVQSFEAYCYALEQHQAKILEVCRLIDRVKEDFN